MINPNKIKDALFYATSLQSIKDWLDTTGWDEWEDGAFRDGVLWATKVDTNSGRTLLYLRLAARDMDYLLSQDRPETVRLLNQVDIGNPEVEKRDVFANLPAEALVRLREVHPDPAKPNFTDFRGR